MNHFLTPREYFRLHGGRPRKRFGQNFLVQTRTAERIVASASLKPSQVAVEIGPGLGALTRHLLTKVHRLHLIEVDRDLAFYLRRVVEGGAAVGLSEEGREAEAREGGQEQGGAGEEGEARSTARNLGEDPETAVRAAVQIHVQDVLEFDFLALSRSEGKPLVLLGNLPYNITSPLMFHLIESRDAVSHGVFMVQREVGDRLTASPGTREYGVLSVLLSLFARVVPLFVVGPGQFYPPPRVDSLVLRLDMPEMPPEEVLLFPFLRRLVSMAFQKRRKTLHNALKDFEQEGGATLRQAFQQAAIDPQRRPETLTPDEYLALAKVLREGCGNCQTAIQKGEKARHE